MASVLGIRSYLLGDKPDDEEYVEPQEQPRELAAVHQAMANAQVIPPHQPYVRTSYFPLRIAALLVCVCITLSLVSLIVLTVPVSIGKWVLRIVIPKAKLHEFYTVGVGLYVCWVCIRGISLARSWLPKGWNTIYQSLYNSFVIGLKAVVVCTMLLGVVPLLIGKQESLGETSTESSTESL